MEIGKILQKIIEQFPDDDKKTFKSRDRFQKNIKRFQKALEHSDYVKSGEIINSLLRNIDEVRKITRGKEGNSNICSIVEYPDRLDSTF